MLKEMTSFELSERLVYYRMKANDNDENKLQEEAAQRATAALDRAKTKKKNRNRRGKR